MSYQVSVVNQNCKLVVERDIKTALSARVAAYRASRALEQSTFEVRKLKRTRQRGVWNAVLVAAYKGGVKV